jgi:acetylornithine deacetylase/succinyl-diaminopimelate desuccinylase family protein
MMIVDNAIARKICEWIQKNQNNIIAFCCDLIKYKSVTGNEAEIQENVIYPFISNNINTEYLKVFSEDSHKYRPNIVGVFAYGNRPKNKGSNLLLNAHVDVVDVDENQLKRWLTDPWTSVVKDGKIYGRGASDMKGGISAMLWAIKAIQELGLEIAGKVGFELVVGEELMHHEVGTSAATKHLINRGYNFDFCIIPEPTSCEIHVASCGTFDFEIEVVGKEIHTANRNCVLYPQRWGIPCGSEVGVDAIEKIIEIVGILRKLEKQFALRWRNQILGGGGFPAHEDLQGVGCTFTINVSFIEGGTYIAAVPGIAKIKCQCYYPYWVSYEEVKKVIEDAIKHFSTIDDWLKENPPKVEFGKIFHWPPYRTDPENPACKILGEVWEKATNSKAIYSGFKAVDDLAFIQALGIPGVSFGPGDLSMGAHGPNEYVPIQQIIDCAKALALFIASFCE